MKGQESDQNQDIWNLLGGSVDLKAYIGICMSPSHQEICGCPMPSAAINMNELAWHRPVSTDLMPCWIWPTAVLFRQPPRRKRREIVGTCWNNFQDPEEIWRNAWRTPIPGGANSTPSIREHKVFNLLLDPVLPTAGVPSAGTACEDYSMFFGANHVQFMRSWS